MEFKSGFKLNSNYGVTVSYHITPKYHHNLQELLEGNMLSLFLLVYLFIQRIAYLNINLLYLYLHIYHV